MQKYKCTVCGFIYDPGKKSGIAFENLPDDWCCPDCGVGKDAFEPLPEGTDA